MSLVTPDVVRHVAALARLDLAPESVEGFCKDLSAILAFADALAELGGVAAPDETRPTPRREDVVETPLGAVLIGLSADRVGDEVRVSAVMGEET